MTSGPTAAAPSESLETLPLLDLVSQGQALADSGDVSAAIALYRAWLQHNSGGLAFAAHYNLGALLSGTAQWRAAEASFRAAIASKPWFLESHKALSGVLVQQGRREDAMGHWYTVIADGSSGPEDAQAVVDAAAQEIQELLKVNASPFQGQRSLAIHPWVDSVIVQNRMASRLALAGTGVYWHKMAGKTSYGHTKIRIGYLASSLASLPYGLVQALALHDRAQFEVWLFSWESQAATQSAELQGTAQGHHFNIVSLTDDQAACLIREHEIDILIDTHSLSLDGRPNILRYHPATHQIVWPTIGGATMLPDVDFQLTDAYCSPAGGEYSGQGDVLRMPHCLHLLKQRPEPAVARNAPTVLAFAGDPLRVTPDMRDTWLRILARVPDSTLRLAGFTPAHQAHWHALAQEKAVNPERVQFTLLEDARTLPLALQRADLFLDTFPMASPEMACCALSAGLLVVTAQGQSMASRMTASSLKAAGLDRLIATGLEEYEALAIQLASDQPQQHALRVHLCDLGDDNPSLNARDWVRALEALYLGIVRAMPTPTPRKTYSTETLAYLRPLTTNTGASPAKLGPGGADRRYVIAAPPYQHNSAGIRVLYDLQRWLVCAGLDAIVCTWFQGYPVEQFADDIVIYPEVAPGNLLQAKRVVRYILNTPGKLGHGEKHYAPDEVLVAYNRHLAPYANGRVLQVPSIEPFFHAAGRSGAVNAFYVGKGRNTGAHPTDSIEITKTFPATRRDMAQFLRTVDTLYTYDNFTMLAPEAQRCGCKVKLIHSDGSISDCPIEPFPSEDEFRVQLHEFIQMTQNL